MHSAYKLALEMVHDGNSGEASRAKSSRHDDNPTCEACSSRAESSRHVLWDYEKAQEIWKLSHIPFDVRGANFLEFVDLFWHLKFKQRKGDDLLELQVP